MQTINTNLIPIRPLAILLLILTSALTSVELFGQQNVKWAKGYASAGRQILIKKENGNSFFGYLNQANNDTIIPPIYASLSLFNKQGYCLGKIKWRNQYLLFDSMGTIVKNFGQNYDVISSPKGLISTTLD
ncbi:MAG: hypothetical protein AAF597_00835, partial [Bacteroidota bacterium]